MKEILVVGGGIIGLMSAYYLEKAGHKVTVVDKYDFLTNCSTGNAGLIVPSHFVPLASPGVTRQAIKWIFNNKGPFSINFSPNLDMMKWGINFLKASTKKNVESAAPILFAFNNLSKALYKELHAQNELDFSYKDSGLLMLCKSQKTFEEETLLATQANKIGIKTEVLDRDEVNNSENSMKFDVSGGVLYPDDAMLSPSRLVSSLIKHLRNKNVRLIADNELLNFTVKQNKITEAITHNEKLSFDEIVIAAGFSSQKLFKQLNIKTKLQSGKGYSFNYTNDLLSLNTPLILVDARVAVSPYKNYIRFGGMMEIGGRENIVNKKRIQGMVESIRQFMPEIKLEQPISNTVWSGLRPCSIDGLPYIGRVNNYDNVIVATGHSMMGISLAPATGKLVEEIVSRKNTSFDIKAFNPER